MDVVLTFLKDYAVELGALGAVVGIMGAIVAVWKNFIPRRKVALKGATLLARGEDESINVERATTGNQSPHSSGVTIAIIRQEPSLYSRSTTVDFSIVNSGKSHQLVSNLSVEIMGVVELNHFSITTQGAPFTPIEYEVSLDPEADSVSVTGDRFVYAPHERDDFRLELHSPKSGLSYRLRLAANQSSLDGDDSDIHELRSLEMIVEFPGNAQEQWQPS